jgi:hypothetical protein
VLRCAILRFQKPMYLVLNGIAEHFSASRKIPVKLTGHFKLKTKSTLAIDHTYIMAVFTTVLGGRYSYLKELMATWEMYDLEGDAFALILDNSRIIETSRAILKA